MILSASRRTDIPAYYSSWLLNRLQEGSVCVRNPFNRRQVSRIRLDGGAVEAAVLWTKNPAPMLGRLDALVRLVPVCCFQFTVNAYGRDVETNLPDREAVVIPAFKELSGRLGPERVVWRYDPIFLTERCGALWHMERFAALADALAPHTRKCVISFLDLYQKTRRNMEGLGLLPFPPEKQRQLAGALARIARAHGLAVESCAEPLDLSCFGIAHGRCVDAELLARLAGLPPPKASKDRSQRAWCGCAPSVDIGAYDCCPTGCLYCYANRGRADVAANAAAHDPSSPLLIGALSPGDKVTERRAGAVLGLG